MKKISYDAKIGRNFKSGRSLVIIVNQLNKVCDKFLRPYPRVWIPDASAHHIHARKKMARIGSENQACIKSWILEGFSEFAAVQTEFMKGLVARNGSNTYSLADHENGRAYLAGSGN